MADSIGIAAKIALAELIKKREAFQATTFEPGSEEYPEYLSYHARQLFDTVIVLEEFSSRHEDSTEWLIFNYRMDTLREATEEEDEMLRHYDQEVDAWRDQEDAEYIISKDAKGVHPYDEKEEETND